jgi:hypothetical protein
MKRFLPRITMEDWMNSNAKMAMQSIKMWMKERDAWLKQRMTGWFAWLYL